MRIEQSTVEAMSASTKRASDEEIEQVFKLLKKGPVHIAELEKPLVFGGAVRAMAKRRGLNVEVRADKSDRTAIFIVLKKTE